MKKYVKKKLALGGNMDTENTYDAIVGVQAPYTNSSIGAGLINKPPTSIATKGPSMTSSVAKSGGGGVSAGAYQGAAALGTGLMDAIDSPNQYGNQSSGVTIGKGALTGAATGATLGSAVPGIGTAIGAAAGAIIGGVTGVINAKKIKRKERQLYADQNIARNKYDNAVSNALSSDRGLVDGYKGASYFKNGGSLPKTTYALGGPLGDPVLGNPIPGAPVRNLPPDNRRLRKIDSLATAWGVPTQEITTTALYNYGATKANGGVPRRMDYMHPVSGKAFYDYYDDIDRGTTAYNTGTRSKFATGGILGDPPTKKKPFNAALPGPTKGDVIPLDKKVLLDQVTASQYPKTPEQISDKEVKNWTKEYISSPKYLERLGNFYKDPKKVQQQRLDGIENVTVRHASGDEWYEPPSSGYYRPIIGNITIHDNAAATLGKENSNNPKDSAAFAQTILAHEYSHASNSSLLPGRHLSQDEAEFIKSRNKTVTRREKGTSPALKWYQLTPHGETPSENKSELDAFRYWLKKKNIYDAGKEDFNWNHLEKAYKQGAVPAAYELFQNFDDDKIIELMNKVASNKSNTPMINAKNGGSLNRPGGLLQGPSIVSQPTTGGDAEPLNSQSTEIVGRSHAQGGVKLPAMEAEVEDGETTTGNFVFSKELGFAKLHRPIAKAIGKIEKKPITTDRRNALQLLKGQEERLALSQEQLKLQKGIQ